jgi:hypothetical protein
MLDTIGLNFFHTQIDQNELSSWDYHRKASKYAYYRKDVTLSNGAKVHLEYYPKELLRVEFSLPHVVFGDNTRQVYNFSSAIDDANLEFSKDSGIPKIDLWDGVLYRLDVCHNHQVDDLVPYFIRAMKYLEISRRETFPYPSGVQFKNGQKATKFYDKEQERLANKDKIGALAARGILRQEITLRKKAIRAVLGLKNPTLRNISLDMLLDILENDIKELGLLGNSIGTRNTAPEKLCAEYGPLAGIYYSGVLSLKIMMPTKEDICLVIQKHPRTLDRQLMKVVEAGVPLTLTDADEPLPPLIIDRILIKKLAGQ